MSWGRQLPSDVQQCLRIQDTFVCLQIGIAQYQMGASIHGSVKVYSQLFFFPIPTRSLRNLHQAGRSRTFPPSFNACWQAISYLYYREDLQRQHVWNVFFFAFGGKKNTFFTFLSLSSCLPCLPAFDGQEKESYIWRLKIFPLSFFLVLLHLLLFPSPSHRAIFPFVGVSVFASDANVTLLVATRFCFTVQLSPTCFLHSARSVVVHAFKIYREREMALLIHIRFVKASQAEPQDEFPFLMWDFWFCFSPKQVCIDCPCFALYLCGIKYREFFTAPSFFFFFS